MPDPMRIRASMSGDKTVVKVLMGHEMESGQRKDAAGKIIPAWFIQTVTATTNGPRLGPSPASSIPINLATNSSPRSSE